MVLSLLASNDVPVSKQCDLGFIPGIGVNPLNFSSSLWLA
jgi:hypothetical protein